MKDRLISLCIANIEFQCPFCGLDIADEDEKFLKRINNNKKCYTTMRCLCGNRIGITYDIKGDMIGFKINRNHDSRRNN